MINMKRVRLPRYEVGTFNRYEEHKFVSIRTGTEVIDTNQPLNHRYEIKHSRSIRTKHVQVEKQSLEMKSGSLLDYHSTSPSFDRYELIGLVTDWYEHASPMQIQTWIDYNSKSTSPNSTKFSQELAYHLKKVYDRSQPKQSQFRSIRTR